MQFKQIIKNSPIRTFDKAIGGGLKEGELGVLVSRSGTGKTGCIVHIATDVLMQDRKVIHVSFTENVSATIDWYKEVFRQISAATGKASMDLYEEVSKRRVILSFSDLAPIDKVLKTIGAVMDADDEKTSTIIFDGYRLTVAEAEDIRKIKEFAKERKVNIWAAVTPIRKEAVINDFGIPNTIEPYMDMIDVLIGLRTDESAKIVRMTVAKANGKVAVEPLRVTLDPETMLIVE